MKEQILNEINIFDFWEKFDFNYLNPESLNEKEAVYVRVKNQAYDNDWSLPRVIEGWVFIEAWFSNMIEGQKGKFGSTRLQYRADMGKPLYLSGHDNSNNGATMWFVPHVSIGGDWPWKIYAEIKYNKRGQPEFARLFAER